MICVMLGPVGWSKHGTPLYDLQEKGGWKSAEMVLRYMSSPV